MTKASHDKRRSDLDGRLADALLKFDRCRRELLEINDELAGSNAEKAERIADAQLKAEDVSAINTALARANAHAADLMAEIEQSRGELERKNEDLARANASAAELMAELDAKREALDEQNAELSKANAHAAELMAEIDAKREALDEQNAELSKANAHAAELMAEIEMQREKLAEQNEELVELNDERNKLLGLVSHDIGNGIAIIVLQVDLLRKMGGDIEPRVAKSLDLIRKQCDALKNLISDAMDISKIEEGKLSPRFERQSASALVSEVVSLYKLSAFNKEQDLACDMPEEMPEVVMDRWMIQQVLTNLISNAIKYTPKGGKIAVKAGSSKGRCTMSVCDTGPGFTEEDKQMAFGSFSKLSARPTGGEKSHGLGLSICRKLVELHNGSVTVGDNPGGGACVTIDIPIEQ